MIKIKMLSRISKYIFKHFCFLDQKYIFKRNNLIFQSKNNTHNQQKIPSIHIRCDILQLLLHIFSHFVWVIQINIQYNIIYAINNSSTELKV